MDLSYLFLLAACDFIAYSLLCTFNRKTHISTSIHWPTKERASERRGNKSAICIHCVRLFANFRLTIGHRFGPHFLRQIELSKVLCMGPRSKLEPNRKNGLLFSKKEFPKGTNKFGPPIEFSVCVFGHCKLPVAIYQPPFGSTKRADPKRGATLSLSRQLKRSCRQWSKISNFNSNFLSRFCGVRSLARRK